MVVQWEDRFHDGSRAHTYLGPIDHPEAVGEGDGSFGEATYPNFVKIAEGFGVKAAHVRSKAKFPRPWPRCSTTKGPTCST